MLDLRMQSKICSCLPLNFKIQFVFITLELHKPVEGILKGLEYLQYISPEAPVQLFLMAK